MRETTPILTASNIGRRFSRSTDETQDRVAETVNAAFMPWLRSHYKPRSKEFWALRDVSFELRRGEALGVIGFNGAGKTTLLRILTGQIPPDSGTVAIHGTSAALIDLTVGFQSNMSGRANVFLRSAMLGRGREETAACLDDIIAFSELGDIIDAPFHTYSAGMKMRLAFSIAISVAPDVLIVDEVLSVGDFQFKQKCLERIRALRKHCGFILVSHSMNDVTRFCDSAIVLKSGQIAYKGDPKDAIKFYESSGSAGTKKSNHADPSDSVLGSFVTNTRAISNIEHGWVDAEGNTVQTVTAGNGLKFRCRFQLSYRPKRLIVGVPIFRADGRLVTALSTEQTGVDLAAEPNRGIEIEVSIPSVTLVPGEYWSIVSIVDGPEYIYRQRNTDLRVTPDSTRRSFGDVTIDQVWTLTHV